MKFEILALSLEFTHCPWAKNIDKVNLKIE